MVKGARFKRLIKESIVRLALTTEVEFFKSCALKLSNLMASLLFSVVVDGERSVLQLAQEQ